VFFFSRSTALFSGSLFWGSRCLHCATAVIPETKYSQEHEHGKVKAPHTNDHLKLKMDLTEKKFSWIKAHVPSFGMAGEDITVIKEPGEFYASLKVIGLRYLNFSQKYVKMCVI